MRASVTLYAAKGGYWLQHLGCEPPAVPMNDDRLDGVLLYPAPADSDDGGVTVVSGTFDGPMAVTMETGADVTEQDPADWDLINEVSLVARGEDLVVVTIDDVYWDLGRIGLTAGDAFVVRLHARGVEVAREVHALAPDDAPIEHHLVQVWRG